MLVSIYILAIIFLIYIGRIVSLYSAVAYIEPEKLEELIERLSGFNKKYLSEIQENPRLALHLSTISKSLVLVLSSVAAILITNQLVVQYNYSLDLAVIAGLFVVWVVYLIFVEILPSRKVLSTDESNMRFLSVYIGIYVIFKPVLVVFFELFKRENGDKITEDQKEDIIERAIDTLAEQAGIDEPIVEENEKEMIGQIFQLDVTEVREVMIPRINMTGFNKDTGLDEIKKVTKEAGFSRYPVFDDSPDKVIGILYVKDIFTGISNGSSEIDLKRFIRKPFFVSEKKKISDLLTEFKANKIHIAIVVDEYGGTSGLVTLEDILEEIVGEIHDEHDHESDPLIHMPDNSLKIDANVPLEDLIEELNLDYETQEFETVGGLIYDLCGSVPTSGATLRWKDILFEVDNVDGQRVVSLKAWLKKSAES